MRALVPAASLALLLAGGVAHAAAPPSNAQATALQMALNCDAITYKGVLDAATTKELEPIHTLDGVGEVMRRRGIAFQRGRGTLTVTLAEPVRAQIDALPPGEPIVLPQADGGVVCVLVPAADSI